MRILAVDPGEKRIGLALSDPTGTIATPLTVLEHISRPIDAASIADLAAQNEVSLVVIGKSTDEEGMPTLQSRRADKLAEVLSRQYGLNIAFWDESFSTHEARQARIAMRTRRKQRRGHLDEMAAVVILQSYLDAKA